MCTTACLCSVFIWIQCSCCLIPSAYSVSRSKSCFKCRQTHIRADSYPNKHIEPVRSIVCLCLERSRTQRATQTNRIKTGTATTVSKRTLCWSRHIEIREQYFFFSWDWALFFFSRQLVTLVTLNYLEYVDNFLTAKLNFPVQTADFRDGIDLYIYVVPVAVDDQMWSLIKQTIKCSEVVTSKRFQVWNWEKIMTEIDANLWNYLSK